MLCINYMTNTRVDVHCVEHVTNMILSSRGCADRICELTTMQETKLGLLRISGPQRYHTFFCVHVILQSAEKLQGLILTVCLYGGWFLSSNLHCCSTDLIFADGCLCIICISNIVFLLCTCACQDQYASIDISDNEIVKLEGFPHLKRLTTLLANNNRIARINPNVGGILQKSML